MVNYAEYLKPKIIQIEEKESKKYLDIWPQSPVKKDVSQNIVWIKRGVLLGLTAVIGVHSYLLSSGLLKIIPLCAFFMMVFILIFSTRLFYTQPSNPFESLSFWQLNIDPNSIFFTNREDMLTVGMRIFRVEVLPQNVHASFEQFIRVLSTRFQNITYQIVQQPILNPSVQAHPLKKEINGARMTSFRTIIYFAVSHEIKGIFSTNKFNRFLETLHSLSLTIRSDFVANFHHYKITLLLKNEAAQALRTMFLKQEIPPSDTIKNEMKMTLKTISKALMVLITTMLVGGLVSAVWNNGILTIVSSSMVTGAIIIGWWNEPLFELFSKKKFTSPNIIPINPFGDIRFYRFSRVPETIFFQVEGGLLGGMKAFSVDEVKLPVYAYDSKFYGSLMAQGISFGTTILAGAISYYQFYKLGKKYLNRSEQEYHMHEVRDKRAQDKWMIQRGGMWKTMGIYTIHAYKRVKTVSTSDFQDLESQLRENAMILKTSFHSYYSSFKIKPLKKHHLESALAVSSLKTRFTQLQGSYLDYLLIQGTTLIPFININNEFKKGLETKIAAEFNTPLQLENDINVGTTINTEFLEGEIDAGFTEAQVKRLLITNGTFRSRETVSMLVVAELIKHGHKSIVFDYTSNWSKLIKLFEGTPYENSILYYKLGRTITIDPIHSEIQNDTHNLEFLNLMLDVYAMSFKKDERTVAIFKNSLSSLSSTIKDDDFSADYSTLVTHVKNLPDHEKGNGVESIIATLEEFSAEDTTYLFNKYGESKLVSTVLEFLKTDKTIIIDVSRSLDLNKQVFFTWLMVAKFIHYLNFNDQYVPKFLVIPHLDLIFDVYFLEKTMKYGKISKFMTPLLQKGFGFICAADQVHRLHPNVLTILDNYITFKAIDPRDISTLKNLLNLEEMHGTGIFSKSRKESYQTRYLMTMRPLEAIMKRTDIYQPFPVKIDSIELMELVSLDWKEIITHMDAQGFNMKNSERVILERAQKTVFEKDMGGHSHLIPEIITFLESLRTVHAVGNLYKSKIREELKNVVYPKLSKINQNKKVMNKMRDEILDILFTRGYFVESHPTQASGGQSVRSSYQVSPKFNRVLEDYYETRRKTVANIDFEIMDHQSEIIPDFKFLPTQGSTLKKLPVKKVKTIIRSELIDILQWNLFQITRDLNKGNFDHALSIAQDLSEMYVSNIQARIEQLPEIGVFESRERFLKTLVAMDGFPLHEEEIINYLVYPSTLTISAETKKEGCDELVKSHQRISNLLEEYTSIKQGGEN
ncbi:MAG: hypothetical protein ACTSVI_06990 [Promethearchaeota archaeon]